MLLDTELSDTTFFAGPDEDLATADVYNVDSDRVINNTPVTDIENSTIFGDLEEEARGSVAMPDVASLITPSMADIKVAAPAPGLLDKLKSAGSAALNAVGGVQGLAKLATSIAGPSIMSRLGGGGLSGIPGLPGGGLSSLSSVLGGNQLPSLVNTSLNLPIASNLGTFANYGGVISKIAPGQLSNSYQMGSLLNNVTGGSNPLSIVDRDSSARLMSTLGIGALGAGIPNSFSALSPMAGGDRGILSSVASTMTMYAAQTGNAKGMKDIVVSAGKPLIASCGKSAMTSLSQCFASSKTTSSAPASATRQDFDDITDSFSTIDDGWMRDDRYKDDGEGNQVLDYKVVDISLAREGNQDFCSTMTKGAVASADPDLKFFSMASAFPTLSPEEELRKSFPLTATSINTNTTPNLTTTDNATSARPEPTTEKYAVKIHGIGGGGSVTTYSDGSVKTVAADGTITYS
jgi:hypothetical protein